MGYMRLPKIIEAKETNPNNRTENNSWKLFFFFFSSINHFIKNKPIQKHPTTITNPSIGSKQASLKLNKIKTKQLHSKFGATHMAQSRCHLHQQAQY